MAVATLSPQCYEGHLHFGGVDLGFKSADHDACPGGHTTPGVLGGWVCSCPCHREIGQPASEAADIINATGA